MRTLPPPGRVRVLAVRQLRRSHGRGGGGYPGSGHLASERQDIDSRKWGFAAWEFYVRFANRLLVQVDGRTFHSPINGGGYWDTVDDPLNDIGRMEVNDIINVITKTAKDTQGSLFSQMEAAKSPPLPASGLAT